MRVAVLLAAVVVATTAARAGHACTNPPKRLLVHHTELVQRATRVALARFEKATPFTTGECSAAEPCYQTDFSTVEVLKGQVPARFSLLFAEESPAARKARSLSRIGLPQTSTGTRTGSSGTRG